MHSELDIELIDNNTCPKCLGELDEYWVCKSCKHDTFDEFMASLPELSEADKEACYSLPADFMERIFRGERPITDPTTFAN